MPGFTMTRLFSPEMIIASRVAKTGLITGLLVVCWLLVSTGISMAQQSSSSQVSPYLPSYLSPTQVSRKFEIRQRFLTQQQDSLVQRARIAAACIQSATENLYDVRGQINRTKQTDLENCTAQAQAIQAQLEILARKGKYLSRQVQAEISILSGLLQDYQTRRALASGSSSSSD